MIYRRYFHVMKTKVKMNYIVLRQITMKFRTICVDVFEGRSDIALRTCIHLVEINERSETHVHEAIQIYEEVFRETRTLTQTTTTTTTTTTAIVEAKARLTRLYVKHSSTSTQYTSKALTMYMERFENLKVQFDCSHETTLNQLEELVIFYKSRKEQKLTITLIRTLQTTIVEIIVKKTDSEMLIDSFTRIVRLYVSQGYIAETKKLLVKLRRQIIFRNVSSWKKFGFKLNQHVHRRAFVFLTRFEEIIKKIEVISVFKIMTKFLTKIVLIEVYTRAVTEKTRFEIVMIHDARLRYFWRSKYQDVHDFKIDDDLFDAFVRHMNSFIITFKNITRDFFRILLEKTSKSQHEIRLIKAESHSRATMMRDLLKQFRFQKTLDLTTCV